MRICLIGYGNIAKKHLQVFRALNCDIVASSNRSEKGNEAAREDGIPTTYLDYREMIEREKPDAIINCVSYEHIYSVTKELIPLGIPLLVEKPAGTCVDELLELIGLQEKYKTPVQVALNRRHYSLFHKVLDSIGGRENLDMLAIEWSERPAKSRDKGYTDQLVGQLMYANSIHGFDMLDYYSGGITEYQSFVSSGPGYFQWNATLAGISKMGVPVSFTTSWGSPVPWRVVMYAKDKRFEFAPLETCKVFHNDKPGFEELVPEAFDTEFKAGFFAQAQSFLTLAEKGNNQTDHPHSLRSTLSAMKLAEDMFSKLYS